MKLVHDIHRAATGLLAEGAERLAAPSMELAGLTGEHRSLDAARSLVGRHLGSEESLTFPAMRSLTDAQWAEF